jgi:hypothetical protein
MRLKIMKACMYLSLLGFIACWLLNWSTYFGFHPIDTCSTLVMPIILGLFPIAIVDAIVNYETPRGLDLSVLSNRIQRLTPFVFAAAFINLIAFLVSISGMSELKSIFPSSNDGIVRLATSVQMFLYWGWFLRAAIGLKNLRRKKSS